MAQLLADHLLRLLFLHRRVLMVEHLKQHLFGPQEELLSNQLNLTLMIVMGMTLYFAWGEFQIAVVADLPVDLTWLNEVIFAYWLSQDLCCIQKEACIRAKPSIHHLRLVAQTSLFWDWDDFSIDFEKRMHLRILVWSRTWALSHQFILSDFDIDINLDGY